MALANAFHTPPCSTGRVELAALLCALYVDAPLRVAADASYVVKGFARMASGNVDLARRPWLLMQDGDFWRSVEEAYLARGGRATTVVQKVKAHATLQYVHEVLITSHEMEGNARADAEAGEARWRHTQRLVDYVNCCSRMRREYVALVTQTQQMFLRIDYAAGRDLKAQETMGDTRTMKAKARRRETWLYRPLEWAAFTGAAKVKLQGPLHLPLTWAGVETFCGARQDLLGEPVARAGPFWSARGHLVGMYH